MAENPGDVRERKLRQVIGFCTCVVKRGLPVFGKVLVEVHAGSRLAGQGFWHERRRHAHLQSEILGEVLDCL